MPTTRTDDAETPIPSAVILVGSEDRSALLPWMRLESEPVSSDRPTLMPLSLVPLIQVRGEPRTTMPAIPLALLSRTVLPLPPEM